MTGEVQVQHEIILDVLEKLETFSVLALVEAEDDFPQLGIKLEKQFELGGSNDVFVKLISVERGKSHQTSVGGNVLNKKIKSLKDNN